MNLNVRQVQIPQVKQIPKLMGRLKLTNFIKLSETDFTQFIKKIEDDPLFKRLIYPENKKEKIISLKRFSRAGLSESFYQVKEERLADKSSPDVESLIRSQKETIPLIKRLGVDKFKHYFLYNEEELPLEKIALRSELSIEEVKKINNFIDQFSISTEFFYPSTKVSEGEIHYSKIGAIVKDTSGFRFDFFSPNLARGKYLINYERLERLKKEGNYSKEEIRRMGKLLKDLELINTRKTTIHQVIEKIIKVQADYLSSGKPEDLIPFSQKELAQRLNLDPSLVSRAISSRSIDVPSGKEEAIKYLLPSKKKVRKYKILEIIKDKDKSHTDEKIREELKKRFGITISRRSVASCRKELKIPSSFNHQ